MTRTEIASSTLPQRIERATERGGAITFVGTSDPVRVPWAQLHVEAKAAAAALQARGVKAGDHVAILGPTTRGVVTTIQAVWLAGAAAIVLPLPMRLGSIEEFISQTRVRIANADVNVVVIDPDLAAFIEPGPGDPPMVLLSEIVGDAEATGSTADDFVAPDIDPDSLAILQFTSGSTADPKGVMLPHRTVLANLDGVAAAAEVDPETDVLVSWLPLYHDMGLIGCLTLPMTFGFDLVLAAPQDFLAAPARWMQWISDFGGTATAGPNFSYALAARALTRMEGLDLSSWRIALNGAEPVDPVTMHAFLDAAAPHGFNPGAAFPAFGMAEVAIGGTFPTPGRGLVTDAVDKFALENERYAAPIDPDKVADSERPVRHLARLGRPVPGLEIRITDPETGKVLNEREVGELEISGTSVTPGYYKHPEATAAAFRDGWLRTGDLAYMVDGELVVCGRIKDMIIIGGRNVYPEDVERAAADVDGVRAGNVIAFGVDGRRGKEALVVVAESKSEADALAGVRSAVSQRVTQSVGLPPGDVVLVPPGTLPKTSSGKLQRSLCRSRYLDSALQPI
jgi:fatty-acyl-CoA synthase